MLGFATLKQITDDNVYNRAWTSVLDRLSIGNVGGAIIGIADLDTAIQGRCQNVGLQGCNDEALELFLDRKSPMRLNFK